MIRPAYLPSPIFLCCDIQQIITKHIAASEEALVSTSMYLNQIAVSHNFPLIITQQNTLKFGNTHPRILQALGIQDIGPITNYMETNRNLAIVDKSSFSMVNEPLVREILTSCIGEMPVDIYLYGVLTEACILQTVLDLFKLKAEKPQIRQLFLVDDAIQSMIDSEKQVSKFRLISVGA